MIKAIHLTNFQSHRKTRIKFCSGVNALVGDSDSGKTAILRAIYWVVYNRPLGDDFMSHNEKEMSVTLVFEDGTRVTRGIDKTGGYYLLSGVKEPFRALNKEVPKEIQEALNLNDINIQGQMDAPFLLSSKPGDVAQLLNRVVNLDIIDVAISNIRKKKTEADKEYKFVLQSIADQKKELATYDYLTKMEEDVLVLEGMQGKRSQLSRDIQGLQSLISQIEETEAKIKQNSKLLGAENRVYRVLSMLDNRNALLEGINALQSKIDGIKDLKAKINANAQKLQDLEAEYKEKFPKVCPLCERKI